MAGWTWRHPDAFADAGGWGMNVGGRKVGSVLYAGMSYPRSRDGGSVTLHGGHADVASGAANARIELLVCTLKPDAGVGAIGSSNGDDILQFCSSLVPIAGERLDLQYAPMRQQVVMKVTLTHPGTVRITDITLDYTAGWQTGSQRTGGRIVMSSMPIKD